MHDTGIYCITDVQSGRRYVGSAVSFKRRWTEHRNGLKRGKHHSQFMQLTYNVRPDAFAFQVLLYCTPENLLMYEQRFLDAWNPEFNTNPTAGSMAGYRHSEESRKKMSASNSRIGNPGYSHTAESKLKISKGKSGVKQCPLVVAQRRASIKLRPIPPAPRKLSFSDVREIRDLLKYGMVQKTIGDHYGVSNSVVSEIKTGKAYGWLT